MKILILKPSSLGDVIHALPVLRLLKRHRPESEIYWWIEAGNAPLLEDDPDITGLYIFDRKKWGQVDWCLDVLRDITAMRRERFDVVLDLQGLSRSAICAWLSGAETIIGLDNPREGQREGAQTFYNLLAPKSPPGTLAPDRYLSVLSVLHVPVSWDFEWLPVRPAIAERVRVEAAKRPGRWVMLLPGARWENKRWPVEYFAETVRIMAARDKTLNFAILGAESDWPLAEVIEKAAPERCHDLTGDTSLLETIEWLRLADVVIANDTGPLHLAAALRRPLVPIFGPTDPHSTGPYGQVERVLQARDLECVPCMSQKCTYREPLACLKKITPQLVSDKAMALLERP